MRIRIPTSHLLAAKFMPKFLGEAMSRQRGLENRERAERLANS
jgi:hypothetical protein